jgi:hypothetical protein
MGFYIRPEYMEILHYYYFSIGIFSFIASLSFSFSPVYSVIFILLYFGQSSFAWYLSWIMQKRMKMLVVITTWRYAAQHVLLTFLAGGLTLFLWFINAFNEGRVVEFVLYINYAVFFMAAIWYMVIRFGVVKALFDVFDERVLQSAKKLVISTRESRKDIFTRSIISKHAVLDYRTGSAPQIDELLMNAWREKGSDKLLRRVSEIEMALCAVTVDRLRRWIERTESKGFVTPKERETIRSYEQAIEEYAKASLEYEKEVASKLQSD